MFRVSQTISDENEKEITLKNKNDGNTVIPLFNYFYKYINQEKRFIKELYLLQRRQSSEVVCISSAKLSCKKYAVLFYKN